MNQFLKYAETLLPQRRKKQVIVRSEREAPMVLRGAEKALAERSKAVARARRWSKAELKALLEGPWAPQIRKILNFLRCMGIEDGPSLLALLDDLEWLEKADRSVRMHILSEIDDAIITLRICAGLPPIDDALPGEPLTVFETVKRKLNHEETAT